MDCASMKKCNQGCDGGNPTCVFDWIIENHGQALLSEYPYKGKNGDCKKVKNL